METHRGPVVVFSRELVSHVAMMAGLKPSVVEEHYRELRRRELVSVGGRGRSAPQMTDQDALRLLLSVAISPTPKIAAEKVEEFEALFLYDGAGGYWHRAEKAFGIKLTGKLTLSSFLHECLESVRDGRLEIDDAFLMISIDIDRRVVVIGKPLGAGLVSVFTDGNNPGAEGPGWDTRFKHQTEIPLVLLAHVVRLLDS